MTGGGYNLSLIEVNSRYSWKGADSQGLLGLEATKAGLSHLSIPIH